MTTEKDSYEVPANLRRLVLEQARLDAAAYVLEFAEALDPSQTDWDAETWRTHRFELPVPPSDSPCLLWPIYQAHLIAETRRLMAMLEEPTAAVWNLAGMVTRNEEGRHFTELYQADTLRDLEALELIAIHRPVHDTTCLAFDESHWTVEVTARGLELVVLHPDYCPPADGDSHAGEEFRLGTDPVTHGGKAPGFWTQAGDTFYLTPSGRVWHVIDPDGFTDGAPQERDPWVLDGAESCDHLLTPDEIIPILERIEAESGEAILGSAEAEHQPQPPRFELAKVNDEENDWDLIGDYTTQSQAFTAALGQGPGEYGLTARPDGGSYEIEIQVTKDGLLSHRERGQDPWREWFPS